MKKKLGVIIVIVLLSSLISSTFIYAESSALGSESTELMTTSSEGNTGNEENDNAENELTDENGKKNDEITDNNDRGINDAIDTAVGNAADKPGTSDIEDNKTGDVSDTTSGTENNEDGSEDLDKTAECNDTAEPTTVEGINGQTEKTTPTEAPSDNSAKSADVKDNTVTATIRSGATDQTDKTQTASENNADTDKKKTITGVSDNDLVDRDEMLPISDPKGDSNIYGNLRYEVLADNKVRITGYTGSSTGALNIPSSINGMAVTEIKGHAFNGSSFTGALIIPDSVVKIGGGAFSNCKGFTSLKLSKNLEVIENEYLLDGTFEGCTGFRGDLIIPDSMVSIGTEAFRGCNGFTNLQLGKNIKEVGACAFDGCSGFRGGLIIPDSIRYIPQNAFSNCYCFNSLTLNKNITSIGGSAFSGCTGFKGNLVIPNSVTSIGSQAFYQCSGFDGTLTIGDHVTDIGYMAFYNCYGFKGTLTIPDSVSDFGLGNARTFQGCSGFTALKIGKNAWLVDDMFEGCSKIISVVNNSRFKISARNFLSDDQECFISSTGQFVGYNGSIGKGTYTRSRIVPVTGIALNKSSLNLYEGQGESLSVRFSPSNASDKIITWSSSNTSVATVDANGYVKANRTGSTVITAKSSNGKSAICNVRVVDKVTGFVTRLYRVVLERDPDAGGLSYWVAELKSGRKTGADVVAEFYSSEEMKHRGISNSKFVDLAYNGIMGRSPDPNGKSYWVEGLDAGASYDYVACGFIGSQEFTNLCASYGINRGSRSPSEARDKNIGITKYASRLYTKCLGRGYDTNGLNYWCQRILDNTSRENVINVAAEGFFHSDEFVGKNLNNDEYIRVCYRTFLGREAEGQGFSYWKQLLDSGAKSRDDLIRDFAYSEEFSGIMASYGL